MSGTISWLLIGSIWALVTTTALAQGTVTFMNKLGSVDAPVYDVDGTTPLVGPGFLAQLYAAPSGTSLFPVGSPIQFDVGGYLNGPDVEVPGARVAGTAVVQVRAWRASDGATFEQANKPGGHVGVSNVLTVGPLGSADGGVPVPGAALVGLQSFSLYVVPEPPVFALAALGAVTFWTWRRIKRCRSCNIMVAGTFLWLAVDARVLGQGTVTVGNLPGAPIYDVDGTTLLAGPAFRAQLYASAIGGSLQPIGAPIPFSATSPGYFFDLMDEVVRGTAVGGKAIGQIKAWRASDGGTFEEADKPGGHVGTSTIIDLGPLGGGGGVPFPGASLAGLQSFSLSVVVPEPSVMGLALLAVFGFALGHASHGHLVMRRV